MTAINLFKHATDVLDLGTGDALFREGDDGDMMFVAIEGAVEIRHHDHVIETIGAGGIIGELALIGHTTRSASAVAAMPSRLARVDSKEFTFLVQEHPTFALQVMAVMAERLRRANDRA